jgi:hypothetical protein
VRRAIVVDVVERKEFKARFAATRATYVAVAVVHKRGKSILTEACFAVLVVAHLAPGVCSFATGQQVELVDRFLLAAARTPLAFW